MDDQAVQRSLRTALEHHQAGRRSEAEAIYRQILAEVPNNADALNLLGVLAGQAGHAERAVDLIGRAAAINPAVAQYHCNLGEAYRRSGRFDRALDSLNRAIALKPELADAHLNLGHVLRLKSRAAEASAAYRRAIELKPDHAEAYFALGNALQDEARHEEAIAALSQRIRMKPDHAEAHNRLGVSLHAIGRLEEAAAAFQRATQLQPDHAQAHSNLGVALQDLGRAEDALTAFRRAIQLNPSLARSHVNLGALLLDLGRVEEATASLRRAIDLRPELAEGHHNLGIAHYRENRLDEALDEYARAFELDPEHVGAHCGYGVAALVAGQADEASDHFQQALQLRPDDVIAHSNLLLCEQYRAGVTPGGLARSHTAWHERHGSRFRASWRPWPRERDSERPLRLGFVSADFRRHPVGYFLAPVLEHLSAHFGAVVCYNNQAGGDDLTRRLAAFATPWRDVFPLDDDALADRIRADRIDLLIDLSGHTEGNRLLVFARRPAPIQLTWIGYPGTTGMAAIDYLVADRFHIPPEFEAHYCEQVLRLPNGYVCFDPPEEAPPVGPLPAAGRGYVTFGSFNNLAKLTPEVIATWAEIVLQVPDSRLALVTRGLGGVRTRQRIHEAFAAAGLDPRRVELRGKVSRSELLAAYNAVDVALDPFPYSGGMTTCEALWMGVPVVTCPGETFAGRHSLSHLANVGLTETIATDRREYVELAAGLGQDLSHLAALRAGLREQVRRSPLCDGERFARNLASLLRDAWRRWCLQ